MTGITSYAQNFEDVMLWRALSHIKNGFYIDIGANDPVIDSVSLAFHEHGWQGIHIEPTPYYAEQLRKQRPGDTVIQAAISQHTGPLKFFEITDTGISTADPVIAQQHRERGFAVQEIAVRSIKLAAVFKACHQPEIHWLKIDVEGFEKQVLSSWGKAKVRPWLVVVESTLPLTQIETHQTWEPILLGYGYTAVYFDGLNRYYLSDKHPELKEAFLSPPNVFDGFFINGTQSNTIYHLIDERNKQKTNEIITQHAQEKLAIDNEVRELTLNLASLAKTYDEHEKAFVTQLMTVKQQAVQEQDEQAQQHREQAQALQQAQAGREQIFTRQLEAKQEELIRVEQDRRAREQVLSEQTLQARQELDNLMHTQVQREQEVAAQLFAVQQQAAQEQAAQAQQHREQALALQQAQVEREQIFTRQLQAKQEELIRVEQDRRAREQVLSEQTLHARQELENLLHTQVQREQEVAAQLFAVQQQATQEQAAQDQQHREQALVLQQAHAEREQIFTQQIQAKQETLIRVEQDRRAREQELSEQTGLARQELENLLRTQVQREQEVAAQLLAVQQQAAEEQAAQAQEHREQAQALQQEQTEREQTLTQALQAKQEQLHSLGQDWEQQTTRLNNEVLVLESEKQALDHAQQLQALHFDAELNSKIAEYNRQLEIYAAIELQLKHELEAELQTSLQLKQSLSQVQQSLAETRATLSWRLTAPFRRLASVRVPKKYAVSASALNMAHDLPHLGMPPLQELQLTPFSHAIIEALMPNAQSLAVTHATSLDELLSWHDQQFVNAAYKLLLGRESDAEGLRYYLSRLRCGYAKTHLLTQLSVSKEAKAYAKAHKKAGLAGLPGLPKAIKNYRRGQYLLIGGLFRWLNGAESNHPADRKLRAIEQQIFLFSDESKFRFNQLEATLSGLQHLVVQEHSGLQDLVLQQNQSINAALDNMSALTSDRLTIQPVQLPETAPPLPYQSVEPEGLKQLSPRARDIYFQLKSASAIYAQRAA